MFSDVTLHKLYDTIESYEDGRIIGIFERKDRQNQLDFNKIRCVKKNKKYGTELEIDMMQVGELQDRNPKLTQNDPVIEFRHVTISSDQNENNSEEKQFTAAIRKSG